jgi:hypothetical protein
MKRGRQNQNPCLKRQLALSRGECQQPLREILGCAETVKRAGGVGVNRRKSSQAAILPRLRLFIAMGLELTGMIQFEERVSARRWNH